MSENIGDEGTITVLLERFRLQRLPVALALKKKVDAGGRLSDSDLEFLEQIFSDARDVAPIAARHPELGTLMDQIAGLYKHITAAALANEKQA